MNLNRAKNDRMKNRIDSIKKLYKETSDISVKEAAKILGVSVHAIYVFDILPQLGRLVSFARCDKRCSYRA